MMDTYALNMNVPLGTVVGPGRYGLYWVADHYATHADCPDTCVLTVFRTALPADYTAVFKREEPQSVTEVLLRRGKRNHGGSSIDNT